MTAQPGLARVLRAQMDCSQVRRRADTTARTDLQDGQPLPLASTAAWPTTTAQPASCARVECVAHVCLRSASKAIERCSFRPCPLPPLSNLSAPRGT